MGIETLEGVTVETIATQVYQSVKRAVVQGRLAPGQQLNEVQLAEQLGISRTPLREALRRLEAEGFIMRRRGSLSIPLLSLDELVELYDIRARLEGLAAARAATRLTDDDLVALRAANANIKHAEHLGSTDVVLAGADFHRQIALIAHSQKTLEFLDNVLGHLARYRVYGTDKGRTSFPEDHLAVLDALAARDAQRAEQAMVTHVVRARDHVTASVEQWFAENAPAQP